MANNNVIYDHSLRTFIRSDEREISIISLRTRAVKCFIHENLYGLSLIKGVIYFSVLFSDREIHYMIYCPINQHLVCNKKKKKKKKSVTGCAFKIYERICINYFISIITLLSLTSY